MTSRTKEPPFVKLLVCWEFYFDLFKVGGLGSARHNVRSHSLCLCVDFSLQTKLLLAFSQKSMWRQREEDPMVSPRFKQYRGTHCELRTMPTGNVSKVSPVTRLVVRRPKETTPKRTTLIKKQMLLWINQLSSETAAQGKQ